MAYGCIRIIVLFSLVLWLLFADLFCVEHGVRAEKK